MSDAKQPRMRGSQRLADLIGKAAEKSFAKFGFAEHAIVSHWSSIVGPTLARYSAPQRLRFPGPSRRGGTLHLVVDGPAAVEIQHKTPHILERLNVFFGYPAIAALKLQQGVLPAPKPEPRAKEPLDPDRAAELDATVGPVLDPDLRASLRRLGEAVLQEAPPTPRQRR